MSVNKKLSFNPEEKLIAVKRGGERNYLEVKYRVQILRELYPEAKVETHVLHLDLEQGVAAVQARIELPNGAVGTGVKQESRKDFLDFLEKAETGAIGRACAAVGIGIQYAHEYEYESENPKSYVGVDSPVDPPSPRLSASPATEETPPPGEAQLGRLKTELAKQVARVGRETIVAEMARRFGVEQTAKLSLDQFAELVAWAKDQPTLRADPPRSS